MNQILNDSYQFSSTQEFSVNTNIKWIYFLEKGMSQKQIQWVVGALQEGWGAGLLLLQWLNTIYQQLFTKIETDNNIKQGSAKFQGMVKGVFSL